MFDQCFHDIWNRIRNWHSKCIHDVLYAFILLWLRYLSITWRKNSSNDPLVYFCVSFVFFSRSTGMFVFLYSLFYYYKRSNMSGLLQSLEFFGYTALTCYVFFLMLGTVSFFASLKFVRYIYVNLKMDWWGRYGNGRMFMCARNLHREIILATIINKTYLNVDKGELGKTLNASEFCSFVVIHWIFQSGFYVLMRFSMKMYSCKLEHTAQLVQHIRLPVWRSWVWDRVYVTFFVTKKKNHCLKLLFQIGTFLRRRWYLLWLPEKQLW